MKEHLVIALATAAVFAFACGPAEPPAASPTAGGASAATTAEPSPPPPAAPPPVPAAPAPAPAAPAPAAPADGMTTGVTAIANEVTTPAVVSPDKVIASLRPKLNACYQDGLKKNPKLEGSVTLSAAIAKDGAVSAVTPKNVVGLNPAVIKCLSALLKSTSFAAAGGMNYTTTIDIPVAFSSGGS